MSSTTDSTIDIYANLKPEDFIRGETPSNINEKCLKLCQTYIGEKWSNVTSLDDIKVSRITGGLSNQLYRVQLKNQNITETNFENLYDVTIKLYQPKLPKCYHPDDGERLNDTIVLTLTSQIGLSSKVYGIFSEGVISAFHKHSVVGAKQTKDLSVQRQIARSLAVLHHLSVPIRKQGFWQLRQTEQMLVDAHQVSPLADLIEELALKTFQAYPVIKELKWLKMQIANLDYPLTFLHADLLGTNLLLTEQDSKLLLIDLEYSTYGCRGFDIGVFMYQYGLEPNEYFKFEMPPNEIMKQFIQFYVDECDKKFAGYSKKSINSVEQILHETKLCMLVHFMFWTSFFMYQQENVIKAIPVDIKANFVS